MRLLLYGDSLTAGYHSNGLRFSPWAPALRALLGVEAVDAVGHSGWTSAEMHAAMDEEAADVCGLKKPGMRLAMRTQGPFDAVVILAGTNDLASEGSPERISGSIQLLHAAARAEGARTVAMAIPESLTARHVPALAATRAVANERLAAWARSQGESVLWVDTGALLPYSEPSAEGGHLWEPDGLHLSQAGYAALAERLAPKLAPWLLLAPARESPGSLPPPSAPPSPPRGGEGREAEGDVRAAERAGVAVAEMLGGSGALDEEELRGALEAVRLGGGAAVAAFARSFGPRRLVRRLAAGLSESDLSEACDQLLAACLAGEGASDGGGAFAGLAGGAVVGEDVHREEMYPDAVVRLQRPLAPRGTPLAGGGGGGGGGGMLHLRLHLPLPGSAATFDASRCAVSLQPVAEGGGASAQAEELAAEATEALAAEAAAEATATVSLRTLSRRAAFGAEIECKVWPASVLLARWLWQHPWLVRGRSVLELGAGVGLAGLGAAKCGAARVALTDINRKALQQARENARLNGIEGVCAEHLDWAAPPILRAEGAMEGAAGGCEAALQQHEVLLAADIVNGDGLSELVERMVRLHLAPRGLFLMVAPRPFHRHRVDELRGLLLASDTLQTAIAPIPEWLSAGIEEAADIKHELYVVQRRTPCEIVSFQATKSE